MTIKTCPDWGAVIAPRFPLQVCKPKEEPVKPESKIKFFVEIYRGEHHQLAHDVSEVVTGIGEEA